MKTGSDPREAAVYRYRDNNNSQVRVITKDHSIFEQRRREIEATGVSVHNIRGQHFSYLPPGNQCKWCRRVCFGSEEEHSEFVQTPTPSNPNSLYPIGLPIQMRYEEATDQIRFDTIGYFCCFGCAFAYLKRKFPAGRMILNPIFAESERLLRLMLSLIAGPDVVLKECPEWDLLDINQGPMGPEHFFSGQTLYLPQNNVVMFPAKEMYSENFT